MLITSLLPMDYEGVKENLGCYVATHPYAPTIAEIAAHPIEKNNLCDQVDIWREESEHVPIKMKQEFQEKIARMIEGMMHGSHK